MDRYDQARAERDSKRVALRSTATETRNRLRPAALVKSGLETVTTTVKSKPGVVATGIAFVAALLFRKTIFSALRRVFQEKVK